MNLNMTPRRKAERIPLYIRLVFAALPMVARTAQAISLNGANL